MFLKRICVCHTVQVFKPPKYATLKYPTQCLRRIFSSKPSPEEGEQQSKAQKLLNNSSPLKDNIIENNEWATIPYPEGTHFSKNRQAVKSLRPKCDPKDTSIFLFPGQGTEFMGMGKELLKFPVVKDMFDAASEILSYNLLKVCLQGPREQLNRTEYCQPAILVTSLAALERVKAEHPESINGCVAAAGFSVGEIAALVFAGCFSFERAVKLVQVRAEAMQLCAEMIPGGMMTVIYGADSTLSQACNDAREHCLSLGVPQPVCSVANYLGPALKVIAGNVQALNFITENSAKYKIRKISKLPVSGAFHTDLMKPAAEPVWNYLKKTPINDPIIPVHCNVDGSRYMTAQHVYSKLPKQMYSPVKWEQIMHILYARSPGEDFPHTYECGPGNSLKAILKKVNSKAHNSCHQVFV